MCHSYTWAEKTSGLAGSRQEAVRHDCLLPTADWNRSTISAALYKGRCTHRSALAGDQRGRLPACLDRQVDAALAGGIVSGEVEAAADAVEGRKVGASIRQGIGPAPEIDPARQTQVLPQQFLDLLVDLGQVGGAVGEPL